MPQVFASSLIDAPVASVWALVRDFGGLPGWHPAVATSRIEGGLRSDVVGCVRNFDLAGEGGNIRETLLSLSDRDHSCTYDILESPMPLTAYVATLRLLPVTDGDRTYIEWTASFDCAPQDAEALIADIGTNVFQCGFDALKARLERPRERRSESVS